MVVSFIIGRNKITKWLKKCCRVSLFSPNVVNSCSYQFSTFLIISQYCSVASFCLTCFIWWVLCQLYLDKICDKLFLCGNFTSWDFPHFKFIALFCQAGRRAQTFFHLLHVKTTSYMQQINEQQLHPPSSLFPLFPIYLYSIRGPPSVTYKVMSPMIRSSPEHSLWPRHIMAALICFWMREFRLWIWPFGVHIPWNLSDYSWSKDFGVRIFFFLFLWATYWHKWLRKVLCRKIITICSYFAKNINTSLIWVYVLVTI